LWLLLPFAMANLAGWMQLAAPRRARDTALPALVRLFGLCLT
jgi:hypothetical protein